VYDYYKDIQSLKPMGSVLLKMVALCVFTGAHYRVHKKSRLHSPYLLLQSPYNIYQKNIENKNYSR
jgi:hypothetical protein